MIIRTRPQTVYERVHVAEEMNRVRDEIKKTLNESSLSVLYAHDVLYWMAMDIVMNKRL